MSDGFVYFIQEEESGNIKIGFSEKHPKGRLKDFQTGNSNKLTLLGYIEGTYKDESKLHNEFFKERIRKDNEWFKSSPKLKDRIKELLEESLEEKKNGIEDLNFKYDEGGNKVDIQDGQVTQTYPNGDKYEGEFKNGLPNGEGTFTWSNGRKYIGGWKNGKPHGKGLGTIKLPNNSIYIGRLKDGNPNGHGRMTFSDGSNYDGEWMNGLKHGYGKFTFQNGSDYIVGDFKEDKWWNVTSYDKNGKISGKIVNGVEQK